MGSGSATPAIQQSFVNAYLRGQFPILANATPLNDVHALGSPGLVQEFSLKTNSALKLALIKPDPNALVAKLDTLQVFSDIYAAYLVIGVTAAGYPVNDTTACPANPVGTCDYQIFTKNYAIFAYSAPSTSNFAVRDPFYSPWNNTGGVAGPFGTAASAETPVTSYSKVAGTVQLFASGAIFVYPATAAAPTVHTVVEPVNRTYFNYGGAPSLGFPVNEASTDNGGLTRQSFENGRIEIAADGAEKVLYAIGQIDITNANSGLTLPVNSTALIGASELDTRGYSISGRILAWSTSNGNVATVTGNGESATVRAVGAGTANIYATGEGKTSPPLLVRVTGACCSVGDGAPTSVSQAFQTAIARNRITAALPLSAPAARTGNGYVQVFNGQDGTGYAVAQADNAQTAWVMSGSVYAVYLANGGFTGPIGYPASDVLPGNVQRFASGAVIAGLTEPRVIAASIAGKWLQSPAGDPTGNAVAFVSFSGKAGAFQNFANGTIFALNAGPAYFSSGLILARFVALGGATGALGVPTGDIAADGQVLVQNFEAGSIDLQPGAQAAVEHLFPRHPGISITPATVTPGGRVHIAATGFAPGAALNFTVTGQAPFSVQPAAGAFDWDLLIPTSAKSAVVTVQAKAASGTDAAAASYSISSAREQLATVSLLSGDQQSGFPGSTLAAPLVIAVRDSAGSPLQGVPVSWTTSGGTLRGAVATDAAGLAVLRLRLPLRSGVIVGSVTAGGQTVDFSALGAGGVLQGSRSPSSDAVNQYLLGHHGYYVSPAGLSVPNPWITAAAAGGSFALEANDQDHVRDLLNAGSALVLLLQSPGSDAVVAVANGVDSDGAITFTDAAIGLNRYAIVAVLPVGGQTRAGAFTVASPATAQTAVSSPAGACLSIDSQAVRFQLCDGTQAAYELDFASAAGASVVNLSTNTLQTVPAGAGLSFALGQTISPQPIVITAVVDSAAYDKRLSAGGLFTIFGSGLATGATAVTVNGKPARVLAAFPYQVNAQIPNDAVSGTLQVSDLLGSVSQPLALSAASPGIFVLAGVQGSLGAILNQDATLNTPDNPALRGQYISIYCTGLGTGTGTQVLLNGSTALQTQYAGTVAGFVGLYQVNVLLPVATAPGSTQSVQLRTAGVVSNTVPLAIQ